MRIRSRRTYRAMEVNEMQFSVLGREVSIDIPTVGPAKILLKRADLVEEGRWHGVEGEVSAFGEIFRVHGGF